MIILQTTAVFWSVAAVHLLGLLSAGLARMSVGSRRQTACQGIFLLFLVMVATVTSMVAIAGSHQWLTSGAILALMVLMVVCDFRASYRPTTK